MLDMACVRRATGIGPKCREGRKRDTVQGFIVKTGGTLDFLPALLDIIP